MVQRSKIREATLPPPGLRERNKLDKRQRIRSAARELFSRYGYDCATLRQIARRAHVSLGTLFNYAQDKRDLVFLIFNEEMAVVADESLEAARREQRLIDQLMAIFRPHYAYFAKDVAMSRILLKELFFYSAAKEAVTFQQVRRRLLSGMEAFIRSAQRQGEIGSKENPGLIARYFFYVFSGEIRWWIASGTPKTAAGLAQLRRLFVLQIMGLQPAAGPCLPLRRPGRTRPVASREGRAHRTVRTQ